MSRKWKILLAFAWLVLPIEVNAQSQSELIKLWDFSGGMNLSSNWAQVADNQGYICKNMILDDPVGGLRPRSGYHQVAGVMVNHTKTWGIHAHRFPNGEPFLFQTVERDTAYLGETYGWCDLWVSSANGYAINDSLFSYWCPATTTALSWMDEQYFFNGYNEPIVVTGGPENFSAGSMYPPTPGKPLVQPVTYSAGGGSGIEEGEYLWAFQVDACGFADGVWTDRPGPLSTVTQIGDSCVALLSNFWGQIADSVCDPGTGNFSIRILRSKKNRTADSDSLYILDTIERPNDRLDTIRYYDNIADVNLGAKTYPIGGEFPSEWSRGQTSYNSGIVAVPGSMSFLWGDSLPNDSGAVLGGPVGDDWLWHKRSYYTYFLLDRKSGRISDTAGSLPVDGLHSTPDSSLTLGVPHPPSSEYYRVICRRHFRSGNAYRLTELSLTPGIYLLRDTYTYDLLKMPDQPVDMLYVLDTLTDSSQFEWLDTLPTVWVELFAPVHSPPADPINFRGAVIHEAKMFAWDKHRLYESKTDTAVFSPIENIEFDMDDGDEIVFCVSYEGYLVVYKTRSIWILITSDGVVIDRVKASRGMGLIAPRSVASYRGQNIFLDLRGLTNETESQYRSNSPQREWISDPIKDLLLRSQTTMATACGHVYDDHYLMSYPGTDSTFVLSMMTGGWGVWDFDFDNAVTYDVSDGPGFSNFVFTLDGSEVLYMMDGADSTDAGNTIESVWGKRFLARDAWSEKIINGVVLQSDATVEDTATVELHFDSQDGDSLVVAQIDSLNTIYRKVRLVSDANKTWNHLNMILKMNGRPNMIVGGIELNVSPAGLD